MKKYLGVKLIEAEEAQQHECTNKDCPEGIEGYKVIYEDGYESWSPKDTFEKAYRQLDGLNFGLAIEAMKQGKCVARKGWNGAGMFVCKQIPNRIDHALLPRMQSLPDSVKEILTERGTSFCYLNQMIIVKPDNSIDSWVASSSDTFAEDWMIVE